MGFICLSQQQQQHKNEQKTAATIPVVSQQRSRTKLQPPAIHSDTTSHIHTHLSKPSVVLRCPCANKSHSESHNQAKRENIIRKEALWQHTKKEKGAPEAWGGIKEPFFCLWKPRLAIGSSNNTTFFLVSRLCKYVQTLVHFPDLSFSRLTHRNAVQRASLQLTPFEPPHLFSIAKKKRH